MQTTSVGSTWRLGNHALTAEEAAAGVPERLAFVERVDGVLVPADPDAVTMGLTAPTGETRTFGWPDAGPTDTGTLEAESTGRFYVDWTPEAGEDGLWRWQMDARWTLGTSQSDQDVFCVKRPIAPGI